MSVVTPVYNGEAYLAETIESVRGQSYQNWDYLIVDNCSTDGTLEIAQRYASRDDRIRVRRSDEFLDVIPNWNRALEQVPADARYVKMLHADDLLFPECLARMVALAEEYPSVGVVTSYALRGVNVLYDGVPLTATVLDGREVGRLSLLKESRLLYAVPSVYLMRVAAIPDLSQLFDEGTIHADRASLYELLKDCDLGFVHQVLTFLRPHPDSITERVTVKLRTYRFADLYMLKKYGPEFLSTGEYESVLEDELRSYYRMLVRYLWRPGSGEFRRFHRKRLTEIGEPLSATKLLGAICRYFVSRLLNLGASARSVRRWLLGEVAESRPEPSPKSPGLTGARVPSDSVESVAS